MLVAAVLYCLFHDVMTRLTRRADVGWIEEQDGVTLMPDQVMGDGGYGYLGLGQAPLA
ncbi:MAG TPA: hypothetical protein VHI52_11510 [Verrucomicrobiae bacterium]|nr:hypothetical protein [Verrucomicrobiae bacterium]